jgi:hypothetical protein
MSLRCELDRLFDGQVGSTRLGSELEYGQVEKL